MRAMRMGKFEGLGEVIVGAGGEAAEDVVGMAARGEHEGGDEHAGLTQFADDGEAVFAGQHHVQHHEVEAPGGIAGARGGPGGRTPGPRISSSASSPVPATSTA